MNSKITKLNLRWVLLREIAYAGSVIMHLKKGLINMAVRKMLDGRKDRTGMTIICIFLYRVLEEAETLYFSKHFAY